MAAQLDVSSISEFARLAFGSVQVAADLHRRMIYKIRQID